MSEAPISPTQKIRQQMKDKAAKQAGNMLSAFVIGLGVAGVAAVALVVTYLMNHSEYLMDDNHNDSSAVVDQHDH